MKPAEGARTFQTSGSAYDAFMGRYSQALASDFADAAGLRHGDRALDVGCGPGALTTELVERLGAASVVAIDPSPMFLAGCAQRHPDVEVTEGRAEAIPYPAGRFDAALAQLVLHFVSDPALAAAEMRRVVRPGGVVAACVWGFADGMEMLRAFWDAALAVDPDAPDEARVLRFGRSGEIVELFVECGLDSVVESSLVVDSTYADFDELWSGFLAGIGPAGSHCVGLSDADRAAVRSGMFDRLGAPVGPFTLSASAICAVGVVPGAA